MARSKSSARWLQEHHTDLYVKRAQQEGWRSRAVFKLDELHQKYDLIKKDDVIVDLGAAPGGWSQYCAKLIGERGLVLAVDVLEMEPIANVISLQGDFNETETVTKIQNCLQGRKASLVLSDMAPNITGMSIIDQPRSLHLAELAADFAINELQAGGSFLVKVFQGSGWQDYVKNLRVHFAKVLICKPKASKATSNETYVLARNFKV